MAIDLWRTRPYAPGSFSNAVDRLFEQALAPAYAGSQTGSSTGFQSLPVNVWETAEGYQAALLAPGLDEQSLNVTVREDTLSIEGEMRFEAPAGAKMVWQEFGPSHFRRALRLGTAVDAARVDALYKNGLLLVTMPKSESAKPRQVQVRLGEGESAAPTQ
jgi:HSP20 family protein